MMSQNTKIYFTAINTEHQKLPLGKLFDFNSTLLSFQDLEKLLLILFMWLVKSITRSRSLPKQTVRLGQLMSLEELMNL